MSNIATHQKQAEHNFNLAIKLSTNEFRDWAAISAFYSALHFLEAKFIANPKIGHTEHLLKKLSMDTTTSEDIKGKSLHAIRDMLVKKEYPSIRSKFNQLWQLSEAARYLDTTGDKCGFEYITKEVIIEITKDLKAIKAEIKKS